MISFDISILKKLVIVVESKVREKDPSMGELYQDGIKIFFNKIKSLFEEKNILNEKA